MDYTRNFNFKILTFRVISYFLYLMTISLGGKILTILLFPFLDIFRNEFNELIFEMILFSVNIVSMLAMLAVFAVRDGFSDTQLLRYAPLKLNIAVILSATVFSAFLILLYLFPEYENYRYVFSIYFALSDSELIYRIYNPVLYSLLSNFYVYISVLLAGQILTVSIFYVRGRKKWISVQQNKIKRIRERKLQRAKKINDRYK